jgi:hypothetical protein
VTCRLLLRHRDHRHPQAAANDLRNVSDGYAFLSDSVVPGACFPLFEREPVETGDIEHMRRRPAVKPVAHVG